MPEMVPPVPTPEQDFERGLLFMYHRVGGICELLRDIDPRIFPRHTQSGIKALLNAGADIAVVMDKNHFSAIMPHQLAAFLAH